MSESNLFRFSDGGVEAIPSRTEGVERSLQALVERHLEALLGVRFLASEYATTKSHGGRIDTLGIDAAGCPVVVEYKRGLNENVVSQGLFYLGWVTDHRADFTLLVIEKLGSAAAGSIDWRCPRLICVAGDFTKFDVHSVEHISKDIELVRYRRYGTDLLLLEQIAKATTKPGPQQRAPLKGAGGPATTTADAVPTGVSAHGHLLRCSPELQGWFGELRAFMLELGDDVDERVTQDYIAYRRKGGFAWVRFNRARNRLAISTPLPPNMVQLENGFAELNSKGNVIILVDKLEDVERAKPIIAESYSIS